MAPTKWEPIEDGVERHFGSGVVARLFTGGLWEICHGETTVKTGRFMLHVPQSDKRGKLTDFAKAYLRREGLARG